MSDTHKMIPVDHIDVDFGWNCREEEVTEDSVGTLAQSIEDRGLDSPIIVRPVGDGYQLVSGFRRFVACAKVLKWASIPAFVKNLTEEQARLANFSENVERKQLTLWDEIMFIKRTFDEGVSMQSIQETLNRSYDWVRVRRQIWELPEVLIDLTRKGTFKPTHIKEMLSRGPEHQEVMAKNAEKAKRRQESPTNIVKSTLIRRTVRGRKDMSRMMSVLAETGIIEDKKMFDILGWAMGELDTKELCDRIELDKNLLTGVKE